MTLIPRRREYILEKNIEKKAVTLKPVNVKTYTTTSGALVLSHQAKHKVADKDDKDVKNKKGQQDPNSPKKPKNAGQKKEKGVLQIDAPNEPQALSADQKHTSSVLTIKDDYGRTGYFKPAAGEVWEGYYSDEMSSGRISFREGIRDDRLGRKEVLASDIGNMFGMKDNIPKTDWAKVSHRGMDYGEGSIQMDAHDMLTHAGFTEQQTRFNEAALEEWAEWSSNPKGMTANEFAHQRRVSALKNGGMDIAIFDFVIGNADRHGANLISGVHPITGEQKIVGIDHGLSFPNSEKFEWADYANSLRGFWSEAIEHGADVDCTDKFKKSITNAGTRKKLIATLSKSALTIEEQKGTLQRFDKVAEHIGTYGSLTGNGLKALLQSNFKGEKPEDLDAPHEIKPYSAHGVHVITDSKPPDTKWNHIFSGLLDD